MRDIATYQDALQRLIDCAFNNPGARPFASIPANPERDAGLLLTEALEELATLRADREHARAEATAAERERIAALAEKMADEKAPQAEVDRAKGWFDAASAVDAEVAQLRVFAHYLTEEEWQDEDNKNQFKVINIPPPPPTVEERIAQARAEATAAEREKWESVIRVGQQMSNLCFNLAQDAVAFEPRHRTEMRDLWRAWDAALRSEKGGK